MRGVFAIRVPWAIACLVLLSQIGRGEHLPTKTYTTADGLVNNRVSRIVRDSRGFLWFCTEDGLSRFDGYSFTNYTVDQGLPDNEVNDLLESRDGGYWIATGKGLCRFNPRGLPSAARQAQGAFESSDNPQPMFTVYRPGDEPRASAIRTLYEDRSGGIWCGTWQGLYRLERTDGQIRFLYVDIGMPPSESQTHIVKDILEDRRGMLWVTTDSGLYRRFRDGRTDRFTTENGLSSNIISGLVEDHEGSLWVGDRYRGLCRIASEPGADGSIVAGQYSVREGLPCAQVTTLYESREGKLLVGTNCGLSEMLLERGGSSQKIRDYLGADLLPDPRVWCLAEDTRGYLWIGSAGGAVKVTRSGLTIYTEADGLGAREVVAITQTRSGEICVGTRSGPKAFINKFDGRRFFAIEISLPGP